MRRALLIFGLAVWIPCVMEASAQNAQGENTSRRDRGDRRRDRSDRDRSDRTRTSTSEREPVQTASAPDTVPSQPVVLEPAAELAPAQAPVENVSTNSGPGDPTSFEAFRLIVRRNIFDPNRSRDGVRPPPTTSAPSAPPPRREFFTLVGSISYDKGDFAFFDGTSSEYRKTVKPGDTFAGYKVAEVGPNTVKLESEGKTVELPVGSQMKRTGDEEWKLNAQAEPIAPSSSSASSSSSGASSSGDEPSDALKRLLEAKKNEK